MLNAVPIIGWLLSFLLATSLAIPFWFIWTFLGVGEMFEFLPDQFQAPGFWATVGIFICLSIIRAVVLPHSFSSGDKSD